MFVQINDTISIRAKDIVFVVDKDCIAESKELDFLNHMKISEHIYENKEDIKSYVVAREENNKKDKKTNFVLYTSTKSSFSLLNKYNKLEE